MDTRIWDQDLRKKDLRKANKSWLFSIFISKIQGDIEPNPHSADFLILINGENTTLDSKEEGDNYA